jgi:hypothetical protein
MVVQDGVALAQTLNMELEENLSRKGRVTLRKCILISETGLQFAADPQIHDWLLNKSILSLNLTVIIIDTSAKVIKQTSANNH